MRLWVCIDTFQMGTDKERAKKVAEEGAEAFSAWEASDRCIPIIREPNGEPSLGSISRVLYECCDVIQAACNLMASMGAAQEDVDRAMRAVREHNEERGRYA